MEPDRLSRHLANEAWFFVILALLVSVLFSPWWFVGQSPGDALFGIVGSVFDLCLNWHPRALERVLTPHLWLATRPLYLLGLFCGVRCFFAATPPPGGRRGRWIRLTFGISLLLLLAMPLAAVLFPPPFRCG